ncbi:response regulator transcription factor [Leptolyngbya sp. FACHB-261]|uniref:response regulator transcription factor n=1 Tax=Leptolyngbya sp. FACHB-261 TaxID=2692806 RepID=UPI001688971D|nr:response regulator transcription factor [Leptolyngbya sp. FACHB-261]MBD2102640.1 response regulator transcription factor [Leptolyngbya sp. FACHB-261]
MTVAQPRFLVVEDHPEVAQNNCDWLQRLEAQARCIKLETPEQALDWLTLETADLVVVDLLFGQTSGEQSAEPGLDLLRRIFEQYPSLNVMVYSSEPLLLAPLVERISNHAGGFAAVNKMERRTLFLEGARSALNGELRVPKELRRMTRLTERELEVLVLLCKDCLTDQAIADRLHVSKKTAQNYVQRLKEKLDVDLIDENSTNSRVAVCMEGVRRKLLLF